MIIWLADGFLCLHWTYIYKDVRNVNGKSGIICPVWVSVCVCVCVPWSIHPSVRVCVCVCLCVCVSVRGESRWKSQTFLTDINIHICARERMNEWTFRTAALTNNKGHLNPSSAPSLPWCICRFRTFGGRGSGDICHTKARCAFSFI